MTAAEPAFRPVTVYRATTRGFPPLRPYVREVWGRRTFLWHLARSQLKGESYDTALGQLWIILDPMVLATIYFVVRTVVSPLGGAEERNLLISHLIWASFVFGYTRQSLVAGSSSITGNQGLVLNASFPRAILPLVTVLKSFLDMVPGLIVYLVIHEILRQPTTLALLWLFPVLALLTVFNIGLALFWAPLVVFYRDMASLVRYIGQVWMWVTPVLYLTYEIQPELKRFLVWNPLYPFFGALEQIWAGRTPSPAYLLAATAWAVGMFAAGAMVFLKRERQFAVRL